jgi:hypothetical protein
VNKWHKLKRPLSKEIMILLGTLVILRTWSIPQGAKVLPNIKEADPEGV